MTTALLWIDIQNDFCEGGALCVPRGSEIVTAANRLAKQFDCIIATQDWHPDRHTSFAENHENAEPFSTFEASYGTQVLWPRHCVIGSKGAAFHPDLEIDCADLIIRKGFRESVDSYSAFYENDRKTQTGLSGYLRERGIKTISLCGLAFDFCVLYSALDGRKEGFEVIVIEDACRAIDLDGSYARACSEMAAQGVKIRRMNEIL